LVSLTGVLDSFILDEEAKRRLGELTKKNLSVWHDCYASSPKIWKKNENKQSPRRRYQDANSGLTNFDGKIVLVID
jgi:hypothetical protein